MIRPDIRTVFAAMLIAGMVALVCLGLVGIRAHDRVNESKLGRYKVSVQRAQLTGTAQIMLKLQVQEWKNVLLRSEDTDAYYKHLSQFDIHEREAIAATSALVGLLDDDAPTRAMALEFEQRHRALGASYRSALRTLNASDEDPQRGADETVKEADREPFALLERIRDSITLHEQATLSALEARVARSELTVLVLTIGVMLASLAALIQPFNRRVGRPLSAAIGLAQRLSCDDYSGEVETGRTDETGRLLGALAIMRDNLMRSRVEVERAQEDLVRKERLAALGQLTATVSHELRNPLGTLTSFVHVLQRHIGSASSEADRAMARITRSIARCDHIIEEFLDFTRAGSTEPHSIQVDTWLSEVLDEFGVPSGVRLGRDLAAGEARVLADPERLRRAVLNLYENACQAMTANQDGEAIEGCVSVSTAVVDDRVELRVADDGPGIPDQQRLATFEPLYSTKAFGVGLGLSIVRQIVESSAGEIALEDRRETGASFVMRPPLEA